MAANREWSAPFLVAQDRGGTQHIMDIGGGNRRWVLLGELVVAGDEDRRAFTPWT